MLPTKVGSSMSPLLIFHITTASIALLDLHDSQCNPVGTAQTQTLNALVGALTCYLVASG
jgi:hypothetical protein